MEISVTACVLATADFSLLTKLGGPFRDKAFPDVWAERAACFCIQSSLRLRLEITIFSCAQAQRGIRLAMFCTMQPDMARNSSYGKQERTERNNKSNH